MRLRNEDWLIKWEPTRIAGMPDLTDALEAFAVRCSSRERERQLGTGYGFGIFVDGYFAGEINVSSVQRGPFQSGYVGYWIDEARAGNGYVPEALVVVARYGFEDLRLHRLQVAIIPRNRASRRVVEKLDSARRAWPCATSRSTASGRTTSATPSPPRTGSPARRVARRLAVARIMARGLPTDLRLPERTWTRRADRAYRGRMAQQVVGTAQVMCTFGTTPAVLTAIPTGAPVTAGGQPAATIQDFKAMANVAPFGMCMTPSNPQVAAATSAALGVLTPHTLPPGPERPVGPGLADGADQRLAGPHQRLSIPRACGAA